MESRVRAVERPRVARLPPELAQAARECAGFLRAAGRSAWIVGGAVRDLALGRTPADVDLASEAVPDELERLFPRAHAVGRAFGTLVVHTSGGIDVEVTTFRSETGYSDGRRPDQVRFGSTLEEDAERRDFTCNAFYLDPHSDEFRDPCGGLVDLAAGRLRCVGEPERRFAEDGLRLLRLVRLATELGLTIEARTRAAAAASGAALRGVSAERVLAECARMARGPAPAQAFDELHALGLLALLPGFARLEAATWPARLAALRKARALDPELLLAVLFHPREQDRAAALEALEELRPARSTRTRVARAWELASELARFLAPTPPASRAQLLRLLHDEHFACALATFEAWARLPLARDLAAERARLAPGPLLPEPCLTSRDLAAAGVPRGPRFGQLLRAAQDAELDGEFTTRAGAEAWLAKELARDPSGRREDPA